MTDAPAFADYWSLRYSAGGHFVTRHVAQYLGAACAWAAQAAGFSPSQVTVLGTATFLAGAWAFVALPDGAAGVAICLLLFQLGYALDCADGQLARATDRASAFGAWLDIACDYLRNIVLGGAVALWLALHGEPVLGAAAGVAFAAGEAVYLHTLSALRGDDAAPATPRGPLRELATALLDTPSVLLVLAVLRPWPVLLGSAAAAAGAAYFATGLLLARARLTP